jgi:UDP-galactopyranose mutase
VPTPDVHRIITGALTDDVAQVGATAEFWYPWRGGIEALASALASRVRGISLGSELRRIDLRRRSIELVGGDEVPFERLIFTLPLCLLPQWIEDLPRAVADACSRLAYQGIFNVNIGVKREGLSDKHWIYFYEDEFPFHRLSFPSSFSPHNVPAGHDSISTEVAYSPHRALDRDGLVERTLDALRTARILDADDEIDLVVAQEIAPAYVIYDLEHQANVGLIRSWLAEQGIWTAGRFGEWGYLNMDQSMKSGRNAAEAALAHARR